MVGITNIYGGGQARTINLVAIDTSLIASANNAALNLRLISQVQSVNPSALSGLDDPATIVKPWSNDVDQRTDLQKRLDFLSDDPLINYDQPYFKDINNTQTDKNLFAMYNALSRMKDMADYAAKGTTLSAELGGLNRRFQENLTDFDEALESLSLVGVQLLRGEKTDSVKVEDITRKETGDLKLGIITDQGFDGAISGLTGTETFTVTANGVDVTMDFSGISGTLSVENIVTYMNSQLEAAELLSAIKFEYYQNYGEDGFGTGEFGLKINGTSLSTISFSDPNASASVSIFGNAGGSDQPGLKVERLSDLNSADPTIDVSEFQDYGDKTDGTYVTGTATDSNGNVFAVGYTNQSPEQHINQAEGTDAFLRKYDSAGNLLWEQLLGAKETASGVDITVDSSDNVIIVGQVEGDLGNQGIHSGARDTFVAKFNNDGAPQWTQQIGASVNDDAYGVSVDSTGNIYVVGQTQGQISTGSINTSAIGDRDGFLLKISSDGTLSDAGQFGTTGFDRAGAVGVANDGDPVVATVENGQLYVRKYDASDLSSMQWEVNLGSFDLASGDSIGEIAVNGSEIYLTGATVNASLDNSGGATITQAHSGSKDGFVFKINDAGASATADWVSYVGTAGSDEIGDVKFAEGAIFVSGTTDNEFTGETEVSATSGFAAKINTSGTTDWVHQFSTRRDQISGMSLVVDPAGDSVLTKLGIGHGTFNPLNDVSITAQTSVRDGQYFYLQVGDEKEKITINDGDTLSDLRRRIIRAFPQQTDADVVELTGGSYIKISARGTNEVSIVAGDGDFNALPGTGP